LILSCAEIYAKRVESLNSKIYEVLNLLKMSDNIEDNKEDKINPEKEKEKNPKKKTNFLIEKENINSINQKFEIQDENNIENKFDFLDNTSNNLFFFIF
jgi:hypothetical protein